MLWVLEKSLACSPRPLRYNERFGGRIPSLPREANTAVIHWLNSVRDLGIGTIVCLATPGELKRYAPAVGTATDLLALYRSNGFVVHHHPVQDPAHARGNTQVRILEQLERLKPVVYDEYRSRTGAFLIQCSGGMDRASPVAAFIAAKEHPNGP